jgi:hypothetical protein
MSERLYAHKKATYNRLIARVLTQTKVLPCISQPTYIFGLIRFRMKPQGLCSAFSDHQSQRALKNRADSLARRWIKRSFKASRSTQEGAGTHSAVNMGGIISSCLGLVLTVFDIIVSAFINVVHAFIAIIWFILQWIAWFICCCGKFGPSTTPRVNYKYRKSYLRDSAV